LPGDLIEIKDDAITVNRNILSSDMVSDLGKKTIYREENENTSYLIQRFPARFFSVISTITIPENNYFFLGDNRDNSSDSSTWGTVSGDDFVGEVVYIF
jgi:signal peptidase I